MCTICLIPRLTEREMEKSLQMRWRRSPALSKWYNESFSNWVTQRVRRRRNHWMLVSSPSLCSLLLLLVNWLYPQLFWWNQVIKIYSRKTLSIGSVAFLHCHLDIYWFPTKKLKVIRMPSYVPAVSWFSSNGCWRLETHWCRKKGWFFSWQFCAQVNDSIMWVFFLGENIPFGRGGRMSTLWLHGRTFCNMLFFFFCC